jgi:hypothetical protein
MIAYKFVVSANRLFVRQRVQCPLVVACATPPVGSHVRAQLVYERPVDLQTPVRRCANHMSEDSADEHGEHLLRCHDRAAVYDTNGECARHSVRVPFAGSTTMTLIMEFMCFNSCPSVNRRSMQLVVTLENG